MRPPRLTIRTAIVVIAITALAAGAAVTQRRSRAFQTEAQGWANAELVYTSTAARWRRQSANEPTQSDFKAYFETEAKRNARLAAGSGFMRCKYERAARYPWLFGVPDPKMPAAYGTP